MPVTYAESQTTYLDMRTPLLYTSPLLLKYRPQDVRQRLWPLNVDHAILTGLYEYVVPELGAIPVMTSFNVRTTQLLLYFSLIPTRNQVGGIFGRTISFFKFEHEDAWKWGTEFQSL